MKSNLINFTLHTFNSACKPHMRACVCVYLWMCVYVCICVWLHVCMYVYLYVCVRIYTHDIWSSYDSITSALTRLCWSTGQVTTMATPNRNCELKKNLNHLLNFMLFGSIIWNLLSAKNQEDSSCRPSDYDARSDHTTPPPLPLPSPPPATILSFRMTIIRDVKLCRLVEAYNVSEESSNTFLPLYQITRRHIQDSIILVPLLGYNFFAANDTGGQPWMHIYVSLMTLEVRPSIGNNLPT